MQPGVVKIKPRTPDHTSFLSRISLEVLTSVLQIDPLVLSRLMELDRNQLRTHDRDLEIPGDKKAQNFISQNSGSEFCHFSRVRTTVLQLMTFRLYTDN